MKARKIKKGLHNCVNCEAQDLENPATWMVDIYPVGNAPLCNKCKNEIEQNGFFG